MDAEGWITQLGRLYREADNTEGGQGGNRYAKQFNRILEQLQDAYPDHEFVQNTEEIRGGGNPLKQADAISEIKLKCGQLADALGYDIPEQELEQSGDITVISLNSEQEQTAEQNVSQDVSIENIIEMINYAPLNASKQDELREIVHEFEEEVAQDDPDPDRLRDFIDSAKNYSVDVSAKMAMLALRNGIVGVLGL